MDVTLALILLFSGFGIAAMIIAFAFAYRIIAETRIKKRAVERSLETMDESSNQEEGLKKRLHEFRNERFGIPMSMADSASWASEDQRRLISAIRLNRNNNKDEG